MRFIPRLRYAHVVSVLALVVAMSGSAYAAKQKLQYTGKQVRDGSITAVHLKNGTLNSTNVAITAKNQLKVRGPLGPDGPQGATGDQGQIGPGGDKGTAAQNAFAYGQQENSSVAKSRLDPNTEGHWYDYQPNYGSADDWRDIPGSFATLDLELASGTNDGLIQLEWDSDVIAHAHVLAWHRGPVHSRAECRMQIWDTKGGVNTAENIGTPIVISSNTPEHNITFGLTGAIRRAKGTHGVRVQCRDLDYSDTAPYRKWTYLKGNLSVVSAKTWS